MKRKIFLVFLAVSAFFGLISCLSNNSNHRIVDIHNSKISLDWDGVYTGIVQSANGSGIDVRLKLNQDHSFELGYKYLDKPNIHFNRAGSFQWDDSGSNITLNITAIPPHYKVVENMLIQLNMERKLISNKLANNYMLIKEL